MTGLTFDCGDDGIAILTIDIPGKKMNLATPELGLALSEAVARVAGDPAIKGAVVTSAKADFMAGGEPFPDLAGIHQIFPHIAQLHFPFVELADAVNDQKLDRAKLMGRQRGHGMFKGA